MNLDEPLAQKIRLEKVLEGEIEREDRSYSREELLALEQYRGFMYTPEDIETMVQKAKEFSFPYHELKPEPTEVLPSFEEMTMDEMFNGPSSMETQPDLEQVQVSEEGITIVNGHTVELWQADPKQGQL